MGGSNDKLQDITNRLGDRAKAKGMKFSTEKSKIMTNSKNSANISMNGQMSEVTSFEYLGAILCKNGTCSAKLRIRIVSAVAAMARLTRI